MNHAITLKQITTSIYKNVKHRFVELNVKLSR